ncbi:hypothetical protein GmRootA79_12800 [Acidovorax sp. A79]|uniref:IPTL-CTERM sorting domain-containing protein n=1 Tax=unclassified Acidovorax TaxID=2684926 RepID=UPI001C490DF9|nr:MULTISPECIES: IPTL-CTERM sorting domain-containing protein [unclassified Acidovorax]MBV7427524.1 IPTL-CTERM sorting domain-containing protein [Acidovorax sp. sif0732]MBV7449884.1 IPTL-CTERM sorting domain-containing protein [Acidovorax sp. sif0715]
MIKKILLPALLCASAAQAATYTVNDAGDAADANPGDGLCATAGGTCTLRAAIEQANAHISADTIAFNFGGVPTTISLATPLPPITYPATIDGYTNGGTPNSAATGTNAVITVRIDGANAGAGANGILFLNGASDSVLRGVAVTRFGGAGVMVNAQQIYNLNMVRVLGNFIGTDGSGSADDATGLLANRRGISVMLYAQATLVGDGTPAGRNLVVARADGQSFYLEDQVVDTHITDNLIGTDHSGNQPRGGAPIAIRVIGTSGITIQGNVIGARETGIEIANESHGNAIVSNLIGVGVDGTSPIGGSGHGVLIRHTQNANGAFPLRTRVGGASAGQGNTIAHWGGNGIRVQRDELAVDAPESNRWLGNRIHSNGALGLELIDPANPPAMGADPAQPPPIWAVHMPMIASATGSAAGTQVNTTLMDSLRPSSTYRVEAFANTACDASGYGEGQVFLGAADVQTYPSGGWAGTLAFAALPAGYTHVALTATVIGQDGYAASSEFSRCVVVQMQGDGPGGGPGAATPPTVAPGSASGPAGQPFSHPLAQYVTATDGDALQPYALLGTLPPGVAFDAATGQLSGTPTAPGIYPLLLSATDKDGTASAVFTLTVTGAGGPGSAVAVPTLGHAALALLSAVVAGLGALRRRRGG